MRHLFPLFALILPLLVNACSNPDPEEAASTAQPTINLYSTRHYDSDRLLYKAFEDKTGIRVRAREAKGPQLLEAMKAEGASSPADLVLATDAGTLWQFQSAGLLQPVASELLEQTIPENFREPAGHWYGLSRRARVIVYDPTRYNADQFGDYDALAEETFAGEICMRSSSNIYNLSLMGDLIERWGEEKAKNWAQTVRNGFARQPTGGDTTQIESIAAGECSVALINHYYWARLVTNNSADKRALTEKTKLVFPSEGAGTHVNITGAGIAANAPNKDGALAFIEFLASPDGQALMISETKEFPMVAGVALPDGLETLPTFRASDIPLIKFGENQSRAQTLYDQAGWK